jgi:hypothetical protein
MFILKKLEKKIKEKIRKEEQKKSKMEKVEAMLSHGPMTKTLQVRHIGHASSDK